MPAVTAATPSPPDTPHSEQPTRVLGGRAKQRNVKVTSTSTERHEGDDGEEEVVVTERTALVPPTSSGRGYDATSDRDTDADVEGSSSPARDAAKAERRILTTPLLFTIFLLLVLITAIDWTLALLLVESTSYQMASVWGKLGLRSRGDGLVAMWVAAVGGWTGVGAVVFFSQPISLLLLTNLFSLVLLLPLFLLTIISPPLRREHYPLLALPLGATVLTYLLAIAASVGVSRAREKEGRRVLQTLARRHGLRTAPDERQATVVKTTTNGDGTRTTTAATATTAPTRSAAQEEQVARVLVGMESRGYLGTIWSWIRALAAFVGGLLGAMCLVLLLCNLCLSAYDNTTPLLREESKLVSVQPKGYPWSYNVHLLCADPPKKGEPGDADPTFAMSLDDLDVLGGGDQFPPDHKRPRRNTTHFPTVLYEAPSGVPGSIAFLPAARVRNPNNPFPQPQPPNNGTEINQVSPYPGSWIVALQAARKVQRVCVWDRPGYGFSDTGPVEFGQVAESLHQALERSGEKGPFILVGDGYGGLLTRVFAAKYANLVHSVLYVDSQSAQTWFRFPPEYNMLTLRVHRFFTHLVPTLISPLGITRFYSLFTQYDPSMSRVLASKRPSPSTAQLSTPLRSRLTAEVYESHTHHSTSYTALLKAQPPRYPSDKPAIILSSDEQMQRNKAWAEGQRALAEEITSEEGREAWVVVKGGVGHDLCSPTGGKDGRGRRACSRALIHLFSIE